MIFVAGAIAKTVGIILAFVLILGVLLGLAVGHDRKG